MGVRETGSGGEREGFVYIVKSVRRVGEGYVHIDGQAGALGVDNPIQDSRRPMAHSELQSRRPGWGQ